MGAEDLIEYFSYNHITKKKLLFQFKPLCIISKSENISNQNFKKKINNALDLLRAKAPQYYNLFCIFSKNIKAVDDLDGAQINIKTQSIEIGPCYFSKESSDIMLASILIHELIHFCQEECQTLPYYQHKQLASSLAQQEELDSLNHQVTVLKLLGASSEYIDTVMKQRGTHRQAPQNYSF